MGGNTIADQDLLVLHRQDQRLHRVDLAAAAAGSRKRGWRQFYLATPSDVAVDRCIKTLAGHGRCGEPGLGNDTGKLNVM